MKSIFYWALQQQNWEMQPQTYGVKGTAEGKKNHGRLRYMYN